MEKQLRIGLEEVWKYLVEHPGMSQRELVVLMGTREQRSADNLLVKMEIHGYLLSEDGRGKLYAFRKNREGEDQWRVRDECYE